MEMQFPFLRALDLFPNATSEEIEAMREAFEPWALEPGTGKCILAVQSYLVKTRRHTILIDTCVGCDKASRFSFWNMRTDSGWLARLAAAGVAPEDVDYVFCTHLHGDHVGWNTRLIDGRFVPTFPNAKYVMSERELAHSTQAALPIHRESVAPILEAGQAAPVAMDYALDDEVWLEPAPGHTPGHVAVHIRSAGEHAVMTGDLIHSPMQCARPDWYFTVDTDKDQAVATRRNMLERCCEDGRLMMSAHFPSPSIGRVVEEGAAFGFRFDDN